MSSEPSVNEAQELRRLIPLNTLADDRFERLCLELKFEEAAKGFYLFRQSDVTNEFVYVLSGTISLQAGGVEMDSIVGGSDAARFALAHQIPRKVSAVAKDQVRFVRIRPERINPDLASHRQEIQLSDSSYQSGQISEKSQDDWISALFRSLVFQRLPPANLQTLLRSVEEIQVQAGDVICRQDDPGNYYYIIKKGQCVLSRKPLPHAKEIKLATLKFGDTFGEDSLLSGKPRTGTVTMVTDGLLLRLDKNSFLKLVRDPVITYLDAQEALHRVQRGAVWLDIRMPDLHQLGHPRDSLNIPFFSLRMMLFNLDRHKQYVLVCEDGKASEAGVFLLLRYGFTAYVLKGGIGMLPAEELSVEPSASLSEQNSANPSPTFSTKAEEGRVETDYTTDEGSLLSEGTVPPNPAPTTQELETLACEIRESSEEFAGLTDADHTLQENHERRLREQSDAGRIPQRFEEARQEALQRELKEVKALYAQTLFEKETVEQEVENLAKQIAELRSLAEDFWGNSDHSSVNDEAEALRAELDRVRQHTNNELATLQRRLQEVETENTRLERELQTVKTQISIREAATLAHAWESPTNGKIPLVATAAISLTIGLLLTALILGGLLTLEPGRNLLRLRLNPANQVSFDHTPAEKPRAAGRD